MTHRSPAFLTLLTAGALALSACTGGSEEADPSPTKSPSAEAAEPASADFLAPTKDQLASGVRLGDQSDQSLNAVAASGDVVVAVGSDASYNTTLPLFVVSTDQGATWQRGDVDAASLPDTGGSELATAVAAGKDGFVAAGTGGDGSPITWTSEDGLTWTRTAGEGDTFKTTDTISELRSYDGSYYLVGGNSVPNGSSTGRIIVWSSPDGAAWKRIDLSEHGLGKVTGYPYGSDIAVLDGQIVVAGGVEDAAVTDQPNRMYVWRSGADGETFTADPTPADFGGDFRAYVGELVVDGGRLYLAASGDGADNGDSWDGVVLSAQGRTWSKAQPASFGGGEEEHPATLVRAGKAWVLAGWTEGGREDAVVTSGSDLGRLALLRHPSLTGRAAQQVSAGVAVGNTAVLVGSSDTSGSDTPYVWRVSGGKVTPTTLPDDVSEGRPTTYVTSLLATDDGFAALGVGADSPVAWSSTDFAAWEPTGLAGRSPAVGSVSLSDAAVLANGSVLAVGSRSRSLGSDAAAWIKQGGAWKLLDEPAFVNRGENAYGSLSVQDVAVGKDGVVVATTAFINGENEAHPLFARANGSGWQEGRGARSTTPTTDDRYFGRTPYLDFRSPSNGSISMSAATAVGGGFLIGGNRGPAGTGGSAIVWSSADGRTWAAGKALPKPKGSYASGINGFAVDGQRVVATGYVQQSAEDENPGWGSWVSEDRGRTWKLGEVVAATEANVADVLTVPGGYLALGSVGPSGDLDAAAWTSTDGSSWTPAELDLERGSGAGNQFLSTAVVDGDQLRLVGGDVPPAGGGIYAVSVPVPTP